MADCYTGEIRLWGGVRIPLQWHACDGTLLQINDYQPLYSLIGTVYGGDGVKTFALPDLRNRLAIGSGQGTGLQAYAFAATGGVETVTLTEAQIPAHTHQIDVSSTAATTNAPGPSVTFGSVEPPLRLYIDTSQPMASGMNAFAPTAITDTGDNKPHANIMPSLALNYIIALNGIYPDFQ